VLSATVSVHGTKVTVSLRDVTQGTHFSATKPMRSPKPDTSSAEWIAEAPSQCNQNNNCSALPLTNFGSLSFYGRNRVLDREQGETDGEDRQRSVVLRADLAASQHRSFPLQPGAHLVGRAGRLGEQRQCVRRDLHRERARRVDRAVWHERPERPDRYDGYQWQFRRQRRHLGCRAAPEALQLPIR
jgi:hypothetical protein